MVNKISSNNTSIYILFGVAISAAWLLVYLLSSNNYVAYKCNYKAALFSSDKQTDEILKEFGGDPCMKKGPNRFKIYYSKSFKNKNTCNNYINYTPQSELRADKYTYVLGCEKK